MYVGTITPKVLQSCTRPVLSNTCNKSTNLFLVNASLILCSTCTRIKSTSADTLYRQVRGVSVTRLYKSHFTRTFWSYCFLWRLIPILEVLIIISLTFNRKQQSCNMIAAWPNLHNNRCT